MFFFDSLENIFKIKQGIENSEVNDLYLMNSQ